MLTRWFLYLVWCHCCTMFYSRPAERHPLHLFWSLSSPAQQTAMFAVTPRSHCDHIDNGLRSIPPEGLNSQAPCQECSNVGENWICLCCYEVCTYVCVRTHLGLQYGCTHAAGLSVYTVVRTSLHTGGSMHSVGLYFVESCLLFTCNVVCVLVPMVWAYSEQLSVEYAVGVPPVQCGAAKERVLW